jgi:hypothetical protein
MNCREFELIVLALARAQEMVAREQGLAHAAACEDCARRLAEEQALLRGVRAVNAEIACEAASARVGAVLLAAYRAQAARHAAQPFGWRMQWRWGATWAAALLLALLSAGVLWLKPKPGAPPPEAAQAPPTNFIPPASEQNPAPALAQRLKQRRVVRPTPTTIEAPAPFYPLVAEGEMTPLESGRIVRAEVPAATLINLGVPLPETALTQPVQAELILGQDGLARAIRFLPPDPLTKSR